MSMIEVDPHLFIKCRLCLEESGKYQIVPAIRDEIFFCFGISVKPFDGLPQLICKKCQLILSEYSKTKHNFIQKQEDLKKGKQENNLTTTFGGSDKHGATKREYHNKAKINKKHKKKRLISSSSQESNNSNSNHAAEDIRNTANEDENTDWKAKYQRTFTCTFCNISCSTLRSMNSHQVIHKALKSKHGSIFNQYCIVEMPKIDDKPNLTGTTDQVVYSKKKIIAKSTADYYVLYKCKDSMESKNSMLEDHDNTEEYSNSSFKLNKKLRYKRVRQLTSRSSTETVVLENNTNGSKTYNDCISIDDSDSPDDKEVPNKKRKIQKTNDIDTAEATNMINKLISVSSSKYAKKHVVPDKSTLQQLNRKIISIGRQIVNHPGFNTNRLMKYMEHLNLNIIWLARSPLSVTNNSAYFKIMPRMRNVTEKSKDYFEGYTKKYDKRHIQSSESEAEEDPKVESTKGRLDAVEHVQTAGMAQLSKVNLDVKVSSKEKSDGHTEFDPILLNENPVANPKQLKKLHGETKKSKTTSNSMPTLEVNPDELASEVLTNHENNMPVITFTTSLASSNTNKNSDKVETCNTISNNENSKPETPTTVPRIKVKSVSELMSKETLSRMKEAVAVITPNQQPNGVAQSHNAFNPTSTASVGDTGPTSDEYVILDTVEFPNTKTNSPFGYFRKLLEAHNLSLLETDAKLTPDFHNLLRFRVRFNRENKDEVVLCLSLLCSANVFCIKVKDLDDNNIPFTKISAIWQWQILRIYQGDVVPKVLLNAEKTSPEVFMNAKRFLCLINSIKLIRDMSDITDRSK